MLVLDSLTKDFASRAVDSVSLEFQAGQVHALVGANGAGKSTLCKMIAGLAKPTQGTMRLTGIKYSPKTKHHAQQLGVQIVQQELNVLPTLSLAENLFFSKLPSRFGILDRRAMHQRASDILADFGLQDLSPDSPASMLGVGQQQMLEIAANTWQPTRVLILDEPTAALSIPESEILFRKIQQWKQDGIAIIYISHRLAEVQAIADQISILRDGKLQGTWNRGELGKDDIVDRMTDRTDRTDRTDQTDQTDQTDRTDQTGQTDQTDRTDHVLKVCQIDLPPRVKCVSLSVRSGEILGVAGLVGSGRTELLRAIFGADRAISGRLEFPPGNHRPLFASPHEAVCNGVVMISEDRKADGLLLSESISANIQLPNLGLGRFGSWSSYNARKAREVAESYRSQLQIRCESVDQSVGKLSGGNQQKVVLAKWLHHGGKVFLFDEPTRGIDIGARELVYQVIRQLAADGKGILVVSSDLEELLDLCHRIGVMSNGKWVATFQGPSFDAQQIVRSMFLAYDSPETSYQGST